MQPVTAHLALNDDNALVTVQRAWDGWKTAQARLSDLDHIHWFQPAGAPRPLLHAFIKDPAALNGDLGAAERGETSQREPILVCVLKSHVLPTTYSALADRADRGGR